MGLLVVDGGVVIVAGVMSEVKGVFNRLFDVAGGVVDRALFVFELLGILKLPLVVSMISDLSSAGSNTSSYKSMRMSK